MLTSTFTFVAWPLLFLHISAQSRSFFSVQPKEPPQDGALRLVGTDLPSAGRVEVYHDGQWGTVCDDDWDMNEAHVVCRQLGYPKATAFTVEASNGEGRLQKTLACKTALGTGPIWLDNIHCTGSESFLSTCGFRGWGFTDCSHGEDAGVVCEPGEPDEPGEPGEPGSLTVTVDGDRKFSLDHSLVLSAELGTLFDSGDDCDFTIVVRDPEEEAKQQTICAHRVILSLYPQLNISKTTSHLSIEISQICHPYVNSFIRYLYTRKINVSISSAQCLHQLSYMYEISQLLQEVGKVLILLLPQDSTFHTQVSLYEYGVSTKDMVLQENVLQYLAWNFESLVASPMWKTVSVHMMEALLSRSDMVVRNEDSVLKALENWIQTQAGTVSEDSNVRLLNKIRFEMIPVEKLYDIQFSSDVYRSYEAFYRSALLRGYQFNTLPFSVIRPQFNTTEAYLPRIYTDDPWGKVINYTSSNVNVYNYRYNRHEIRDRSRYQSYSTPLHYSLLFKQQSIEWQAQVFRRRSECSREGLRCESLPMARLLATSHPSEVRFNNRLILKCNVEKTVFQVQDFKDNKAFPTNSSMGVQSPCPDNYMFTFVVRPEYI